LQVVVDLVLIDGQRRDVGRCTGMLATAAVQENRYRLEEKTQPVFGSFSPI